MSLRVPALTLRRVTWQRMSFSDPLVCSGISGRSSTISNSDLLVLSRASRRSSVTKPVLRVKMRSNRAQGSLALFGGRTTIGLKITVEVPDQLADADLGGAVLRSEGIELVNQ